MRRIAFEVPGKPCGKGRPRFGNGRTFTPGATISAENWIKTCAVEAGVPLMEGALEVEVIAVRAIPKSWSKKRRAAALRGAYDTRRPDGDNIAKLVGDALNGIAWADDAQISDWIVRKRLAADAREKTVIKIKEMAE